MSLLICVRNVVRERLLRCKNMIIFKLLLNILLVFISLLVIIDSVCSIKRGWYPKWLTIPELLFGIIFFLESFTVWFIE